MINIAVESPADSNRHQVLSRMRSFPKRGKNIRTFVSGVRQNLSVTRRSICPSKALPRTVMLTANAIIKICGTSLATKSLQPLEIIEDSALNVVGVRADVQSSTRLVRSNNQSKGGKGKNACQFAAFDPSAGPSMRKGEIDKGKSSLARLNVHLMRPTCGRLEARIKTIRRLLCSH